MDTVRVSVAIEPPGFLEELTARLSALLDLPDKPVDLIEMIRGLRQAPAAVIFEILSTGGTLDRRVTLKPGKRLLELMTAMRASKDIGELVLENHGDLPSIGADTSMLARAPAARTARLGRPDAAEGEQT